MSSSRRSVQSASPRGRARNLRRAGDVSADVRHRFQNSRLYWTGRRRTFRHMRLAGDDESLQRGRPPWADHRRAARIGGLLLLGVLSIVFRQNFFGCWWVTTARPRRRQGRRPINGGRRKAPVEKVAVATFNDAQQVWKEKIRGYREASSCSSGTRCNPRCGEAAAEMGLLHCRPTSACTSTCVLPRAVPPIRSTRRLRAGLRDRAPKEVATTCSTCSGVGGKVQRRDAAGSFAPNALSCGWSCRPICFAGVWGHSASRRQCWTRATWTRASRSGGGRRRTGSSKRRPAHLAETLRTVRRATAPAGSAPGWRPVGRSLRHLRRLVCGRHPRRPPPTSRHTGFHA